MTYPDGMDMTRPETLQQVTAVEQAGTTLTGAWTAAKSAPEPALGGDRVSAAFQETYQPQKDAVVREADRIPPLYAESAARGKEAVGVYQAAAQDAALQFGGGM